LELTGYICNVGTTTVNNGVLYVSATHADDSSAIDSSVNIESLQAGAYSKISIQFPYHGTPLKTFYCNLE
jgi:hypothetical protein